MCKYIYRRKEGDSERKDGKKEREVMEGEKVERVKGEMEDLRYPNKLHSVHRLIIFKN